MAGDLQLFGSLFAEPPRNGLTRPKAVRGAGVKMVNMGELFMYPRLRNATMDRVPLNESEAARFLLREGDLLFARQSLVLEGAGKCSIFLGDDEPVTFESHVTRVRLDPNKANPNFYFYYLQSHHGRATIRSIVEQGAGASGIRGSDLGRLNVQWFPVDMQRVIAHILGTLDDKIELNRKMNKTLEAMARAIFKSWFVDFDPVRAKAEGRDTGLPKHIADLFPDSFVESELGEIPAGWNITALGESVSTIKGRSYKSEELVESNVALVTLKSFQRGGGYQSKGLKSYSGEYKAEQVIEPGEVVIACTDVTQTAEVIGRPAIVRASLQFETLVASLDTMIVRPSNRRLTKAFLYYLMGTEAFTAHTYAHTTGTTVLHLAKEAIPSFRFVVPPDSLIDKFDELVATAFA